jgi:hypothetical protein
VIDKPWRRCGPNKPHIYRRAGRWLVTWRETTEGWMLYAAHDWMEKANGYG